MYSKLSSGVSRGSLTALVFAAFLALPHVVMAQDSNDVPSCPTTRDPAARLWCQGGAKFLDRDYAAAIPLYSRALQLHKSRPTLSRSAWRVLVDNLGMAYGITGDLQKAKEIFDYGIAADSTYPMFYYLMADDYAEMGDKPHAIAYLKRAYALRANMIPGETLPDPLTDDSFQRFIHDPVFLNAVRQLSK